MAGVQWSGGKFHGAGEAKAVMRHSDKIERLKHDHANPHVGAAPDTHNFNFKGLDYAGMCKAYDDRIAQIDTGRQASGKNERVTMQGLILQTPAGITDDLFALQWFRKVGDIMNSRYGANFLEMSVHFDEVHNYVDPETHQTVRSRPHAHVFLVPEVDGRLNGKAFASRAELKDLNNAIQKMTHDSFGCDFVEGKNPVKKGRTVESLKQASAQAAADKAVQDAKKHSQDIIAMAEAQAAEIRRRALSAEASSDAKIAAQTEKADKILHDAENVLKKAENTLRMAEDVPGVGEWAKTAKLKNGMTVYDWYMSDRAKREKAVRDESKRTVELSATLQANIDRQRGGYSGYDF